MYGNKVNELLKKSMMVFMIAFLLFSLIIEVKAASEILTLYDYVESSVEVEKEMSTDIKEYTIHYMIICILAVIDLIMIYIYRHFLKMNNKYLEIVRVIEILLLVIPIILLIISALVEDISIYDFKNWNLKVDNVYHRTPISLHIIRVLNIFNILFSIIHFIIFIIHIIKYLNEMVKRR